MYFIASLTSFLLASLCTLKKYLLQSSCNLYVFSVIFGQSMIS